ncbi:MAG: hypothetical protein AAAB16_18960 [Pseudomonas sp.]|uniref:hypothetical protein n=1 Tax=Pseudomonas sp. TaxID=306 RepID=UPI0030F2086B
MRITHTVERDIQAAAIVILKLRDGCKWLDAVADASLHLKISESTVNRACDEYRDALELLPDATLKQTTDIPDISTNSP